MVWQNLSNKRASSMGKKTKRRRTKKYAWKVRLGKFPFH